MFDQILDSIHWHSNSDGSSRYEFNPTSNKLRTRTSNPSAGCSHVLYRPLPISPWTLIAYTHHRSHLIITLIWLSSGPQFKCLSSIYAYFVVALDRISWNASAELEIWRFKINILIKGFLPPFFPLANLQQHTSHHWHIVPRWVVGRVPRILNDYL